MTTGTAVRILPDPAQIAAADPRQSVFVTANAGSGKVLVVAWSSAVDAACAARLDAANSAARAAVTAANAATAMATSGGKSFGSITCAGAMTVNQ